MFTEFGLNSIAAREFSSKNKISKSEFYSFFVLRFLVVLIVIFISLVLLSFLNYSQIINRAIVFSQISLLFFSLSSSFNAVFQSKLKYKYQFYATFFYAITNLAFFLYVLKFYSGNIVLLFIPIAVAEIVKFFASSYFVIGLLSKESKFLFSSLYAKKILILALPLALALVFNTLMSQVDKIMLSVLVDAVLVGYYALAYKLFDVLIVLPTFFMNAAFPVFVKRYKQNNNYSKEYSQSIYFLAVAALVITSISIFCAPIFIPLIWGSTMSPSVGVFIFLILGSFLFYLSSPLSWSYVVENKQNYLVYFYACGFAFNVVLNYMFIPKFGIIGAAFTTVLTEAFILLLLELFRHKVLKVNLISPHKLKFNLGLWRR
jgi:O-antigen/teichoic acid export membrane protein